MFSPYLFDHIFDIDDLIAAMLGGQGLWLETRTGKLSATKPEVDDTHRFELPPLPLVWLAELELDDEYFHLQPEDKTELTGLIKQTTELKQLMPVVFGETQLGGWLREQVKREALQWLADHNLIPPSMRHISGVPKARSLSGGTAAPTNIKKVTIEPA